MDALSDRLEEIAQEFFTTWHVWRTNQGWTLGPDQAANRMSPYLVGTWDRLTPNGQEWFRQHAALIIHSIEQNDPLREAPAHNVKIGEVIDMLDSVASSLKQNHTKKAMKKVEAAKDLASLLLKDSDGDSA